MKGKRGKKNVYTKNSNKIQSPILIVVDHIDYFFFGFTLFIPDLLLVYGMLKDPFCICFLADRYTGSGVRESHVY